MRSSPIIFSTNYPINHRSSTFLRAKIGHYGNNTKPFYLFYGLKKKTIERQSFFIPESFTLSQEAPVQR